MRQVFIPSDFQIPKKVELGNYFLIPISTKNVAEDLEVLTNNAEAIVRQRGGGESKNRWPLCGVQDMLYTPATSFSSHGF